MSTTWNPSDKSANITLSGGDLIATATDGNNSFVRSTPTSHSTGKWIFLFTVTNPGAFTVCGGANSSYTVSQNIAGYDSGKNSWSCPPAAGTQYTIGGSSASVAITVGGGFTNGDIINFAWDMDNDKLWGRVWRSGAWETDWNNTASASPGGTGYWQPVASGTLNAGPWMMIFGSTVGAGNEAITINPAPTQLSDGTGLPAGFSAWDAGAPAGGASFIPPGPLTIAMGGAELLRRNPILRRRKLLMPWE